MWYRFEVIWNDRMTYSVLLPQCGHVACMNRGVVSSDTVFSAFEVVFCELSLEFVT